MSKSQRTKGATGEREVCAILHDVLGVDVHRNLSQTRDGGTDIVMGKFRIEVKRRKRIGNLYEWMAQSERACTAPGQIPVVVARQDGTRQWLVTLNLEDFMTLAGNEL